MINLNTVLSTNTQVNNIIDTSFNDMSLFSECLSHISNINNTYRESCKAIHEEVNIDKIKKITTLFNADIKLYDTIFVYYDKIYNNFNKSLLVYSAKNTNINKYKKFYLYDGKDVSFQKNLYKFNTNTIVPTCGKLLDYNEFLEFIVIINSNKFTTEVKINKCKEALENLDKEFANFYYNNCRAKLCNTTGSIDASNFSNQLFASFRDGGEKSLIDINEVYIRDTYERFDNIKSVNLYLKKEKDNGIKEYKEIRNTLVKEFELKLDDEELDYNYKLYLKIIADKLMTLSNLYLITFSSKLDAIANSYVQDKSILSETASRYITKDKEEDYDN